MDQQMPPETQISTLAAALRGRVIAPHDTDYDTVRVITMHNYDDRRPAVVIRAVDAADVAAAIKMARSLGLPLAVRGGGHSVTGASVCHAGVVIDMRELDHIAVDAEAQTIWVGAGLTAGEVTRAVEKQGFIVGFGDSATVGVAGLTLGGGVGYLARKYGLTADSLLAAEVVTADGEIIVTEANHHPDLFWALRGGGGNFGVVTRLKFRLHALPEFTGGPLILPPTAKNLAGFAAAAAAAPDELSTIAVVMHLPPMPFLPPELYGKTVIIGMMAYAGAPDAAAQALAPFRALDTAIADGVRPAPYSSLYIMDPPPDMRPAVAIRSRFMPVIDLAQAAAIIEAVEKCDAPMKMAQVRVLGGAFARVPNDATAFAHRESPMMMAFLAMYGGPPEVAAAQERWAAESLAALKQPADAPAYVNFLADEGEAGIDAAYPPETLARLRSVKRRYDPENVFRLNQNITPEAA